MKENKRIITVPVTMEIPKRKADGSVKLGFVTNFEISTAEYVIMDEYRQSQGWLLFRENQFTEQEIPTEDVETDLAKSISAQIRDALWVLYKVKGGKPEDKEAWNVFYRKQGLAYKARILDEVHLIEGKE